MAFRERVLPEWLINLDRGNTPPKTKTGCNKSRGNKKHVNVHDDNVNYSSEDEKKNLPSTSKTVGNSVVVKGQSSSKLSPRKQVSKPARARPEMSSSDEEVEVKPDLSSLRETIPSADSSGDSHVVLVPSIKKEDEVKEATKVELDPNIKSEIIEETSCNEDPEIKDIGNDDNGISIENEVKNISDNGADTGGASGVNTDADSGVDILASANADCDAGTSDDTATTVNGADGDQSNSVSSTTNNSNNVDRPKCKYGAQCYRKNPQHRKDFSHPGDSDYSNVDNRPECPYGLACYRKNPLHRQHYKHTKTVQKPRQAKRQKKKMVDDSASDEEDYDLDDPFIDDASSDDYQPSGSDSETDFDGEEQAGSSDDTKQDVKDPKKLKRKRRH